MIINPDSNQCNEKLYTVSLNTGLAWLQEYSVYAYNEQEAVDLVADYLEAEELTGLYSNHYTLADLCEAGETVEDFTNEFGYDISEPDDLRCAKRIYKAVTHEYNDLCRCFTEEQLESLREIQ